MLLYPIEFFPYSQFVVIVSVVAFETIISINVELHLFFQAQNFIFFATPNNDIAVVHTNNKLGMD